MPQLNEPLDDLCHDFVNFYVLDRKQPENKPAENPQDAEVSKSTYRGYCEKKRNHDGNHTTFFQGKKFDFPKK